MSVGERFVQGYNAEIGIGFGDRLGKNQNESASGKRVKEKNKMCQKPVNNASLWLNITWNLMQNYVLNDLLIYGFLLRI